MLTHLTAVILACELVKLLKQQQSQQGYEGRPHGEKCELYAANSYTSQKMPLASQPCGQEGQQQANNPKLSIKIDPDNNCQGQTNHL